MNIHIWQHTDGTQVIEFTAETDEDRRANTLLFGRYDGTGLIGSAGTSGASLQLLIAPLTPQEIADNEEADAMISRLNSVGKPPLIEAGKSYIEAEAVTAS